MQISVIGSGYVGLVTAASLASVHHDVICIDKDKKKISDLNKGIVHINEPNLANLINTGQKSGRLSFSCSYSKASKNNIFFLCVGTPDNKNGTPNMSYVNDVKKSLSKYISRDSYIFVKSTVAIGTNRKLEKFFNLNKKCVRIISNPEFLKEGTAVNDFLNPDRIIFGTSSKDSVEIITKIFKPFGWKDKKFMFMSLESAELTKYGSNAFLATKISFMNEMSRISEKSGADIKEVQKGMGADQRIGNQFLNAGIGYGGSCFPKDLNSLIHTQKKLGLESKIFSAVKSINNSQQSYFINKILSHFSSPTLNKNIDVALWGLSFKPDTADIRESIGIKVAQYLSRHFKSIRVHDPLALKNSKTMFKKIQNIKYFKNKYHSISSETKLLVVCTEWDEYKALDTGKLRKVKYVFDGRNIYQPSKFSNNIKLIGIGKKVEAEAGIEPA